MTMLVQSPEFALHRLHKLVRDAQQRARFSRARSEDPRKELAGYAEHQALALLRGMNYRAVRTGYNDPWDIWLEGAKVEVKASGWHGRYQARIRNHKSDLLLWALAVPGAKRLEWFVIPAVEYAGITNLAIWTRQPADYTGRWFEFYQAWVWVDAVAQQVPEHRGWQLELF